MKGMYHAQILENRAIALEIFDMRLSCPDAAKHARAGQFAAVYTENPATLLPRPLSICEIDRAEDGLRIIYRVEGQGTQDLAKMATGYLRILAPLGNGFDISDNHKNFAIVGGGIGTPPLLELVKEIREKHGDAKITVFLGFRNDASVILEQDFATFADEVHVSTDDGSYGIQGNAVGLLDAPASGKFDVLYGCGPKVMLKHLARWAAGCNTPCFVSLEERMACSIGACLACVVKIRDKGAVVYDKVCSSGPVFDAKELFWI